MHCYPLGLRPRRQHSMPHHLGTVGSGLFQESSFSFTMPDYNCRCTIGKQVTAPEQASLSHLSFVIILIIRTIIFKSPASTSSSSSPCHQDHPQHPHSSRSWESPALFDKVDSSCTNSCSVGSRQPKPVHSTAALPVRCRLNPNTGKHELSELHVMLKSLRACLSC